MRIYNQLPRLQIANGDYMSGMTCSDGGSHVTYVIQCRNLADAEAYSKVFTGDL